MRRAGGLDPTGEASAHGASTVEESYVCLGMFYQSREQFSEVGRVYKKIAKYRSSVTGYCNVGEATWS